jgi:hypothetical protein
MYCTCSGVHWVPRILYFDYPNNQLQVYKNSKFKHHLNDCWNGSIPKSNRSSSRGYDTSISPLTHGRKSVSSPTVPTSLRAKKIHYYELNRPIDSDDDDENHDEQKLDLDETTVELNDGK